MGISRVTSSVAMVQSTIFEALKYWRDYNLSIEQCDEILAVVEKKKDEALMKQHLEREVIKAAELPTTGKYSLKKYQCVQCGAIESHGTNPWGFIYCRCKACGETEMKCLEPVPKGYGIPEKWKKVRLGDICTITRGTVKV